jgi:hypothetical protein
MLLRQCIPLEFTTLVCLNLQQVRHTEAVNTNFSNQLKRGNFEIASSEFLPFSTLHLHDEATSIKYFTEKGAELKT